MKRKGAATEPPLLYSVAGAGDRLGVSDTTVRALVRRGDLDGRKLGVRLMVTAASLDRFASALPRAAHAEGAR